MLNNRQTRPGFAELLASAANAIAPEQRYLLLAMARELGQRHPAKKVPLERPVLRLVRSG